MPIGASPLSALKLTEENMKKLKRILAVATVFAAAILTGYFIYTGVQLNEEEGVIEQVQSSRYMY